MARLVLLGAILTVALCFIRDPDQRVMWFFIGLGLIFLPSMASNLLQSKVMGWIDAWAKAQGMKIVRVELRVLKKGPYTWTTGDTQRVLRVAVRTAQGQPVQGWVCVGSWFVGLLSRRIAVRWDAA